jgi:hypothetical protein
MDQPVGVETGQQRGLQLFPGEVDVRNPPKLGENGVEVQAPDQTGRHQDALQW